MLIGRLVGKVSWKGSIVKWLSIISSHFMLSKCYVLSVFLSCLITYVFDYTCPSFIPNVLPLLISISSINHLHQSSAKVPSKFPTKVPTKAPIKFPTKVPKFFLTSISHLLSPPSFSSLNLSSSFYSLFALISLSFLSFLIILLHLFPPFLSFSSLFNDIIHRGVSTAPPRSYCAQHYSTTPPRTCHRCASST